jgi:hypothetical protein
VVDVLVNLVPYNQGLIPDVSFLWRFLGDFWGVVGDKKKIETLWQAVAQLLAGDLLTAYQYDYDKSISTIQPIRQRRWLHYTPRIALNPLYVRFVLSEDQAGNEGSTIPLDPVFGDPLEETDSLADFLRVPLSEGRFDQSPSGTALRAGKLLAVLGRGYPLLASTQAQVAVHSGRDGVLVMGTRDVEGSGFTSAHVGLQARIESRGGVRAATVSEVLDSGQRIRLDAGATWTWAVGETECHYSLSDPNPSHAVAQLVEPVLPSGVGGLPWRLSSTVVSDEHDLQSLGVQAGDLLEVEVVRTDTGASGRFYCGITGVYKNRIGVVFDPYTLAEGITCRALSEEAQYSLSVELRVSGLSQDPAGGLLYASTAAAVQSTVKQSAWRRNYYEKELTPESEISVGPFSIRLRPTQVVRLSAIPINNRVTSIPMLREFVHTIQVEETDNDVELLTPSGDRVPYSHMPITLRENMDYVVEDDSVVLVECSLEAGNPEVRLPGACLQDRGIGLGDRLAPEILDTELLVYRVLDQITAGVRPTPTVTHTGGALLHRQTSGKFLRFVPGTFLVTSLPPERLWADVTFFDNSDLIEANFGSLVGVSREDVEETGLSYLSVVSGLMFFLMSGRSIEDGRLAAQVLFGLPFARSDGIITRIDPIYTRRADSSPKYGRMVIAEIEKNVPTGRSHVYLYPLGPQVRSPLTGEWVPTFPDLAGLAVNPLRERVYEVGDPVLKYSILSNGVIFGDHVTASEGLSSYLPASQSLDRYHTFYLGVSLDLVRGADFDLAASWLEKERLLYTKLIPVGLIMKEDDVLIEEDITFTVEMPFFDNVSLSLPSALKFDSNDFNLAYFTTNGVLYRRVTQGTSMILLEQSSNVSDAIRNFLTPGVGEGWEGPLADPTDLLRVLSNPNRVETLVTVVPSGHALTVEYDHFAAQTGVEYTLERKVQNPIWKGQATIVQGSEEVVLDGAPKGRGVAVGDVLVFVVAGTPCRPSYVYGVTGLYLAGEPTKRIYVHRDVMEASGTYSALIVRRALLTEDRYADEEDPSPITASGSQNGSVLTLTGNEATVDGCAVALLEPGDGLLLEGRVHTLMHQIRESSQLVIAPPLPAAFNGSLTFSRAGRGRGATPISLDLLERIPEDDLQFETDFSPCKIDYAQGAAIFQMLDSEVPQDLTILGLRPGDFVRLSVGSQAVVDWGYDAGYFPILSLSGTTGTLCTSLAYDPVDPVNGDPFTFVKRTRPREKGTLP